MITLFIDTADNTKVYIAIHRGNFLYDKTVILTKGKHAGHPHTRASQTVLTVVDELLREHAMKVSDITHIKVNPGPGSFTGLRVGIAIANTLSYTLNIPVNNQPPGSFVTPQY